jgi:hypothetical protein
MCWLYYRRIDFRRGDFYCNDATTVSSKPFYVFFTYGNEL